MFTAAFEHQFDDTHRIRNATRYTKVTQDYIWTQPDDSQNNVPRGEVWRRMNSRYSNAETLQNLTDLTGEAVIGGLKHQYAVGLELSREKSSVDGYSLLDPSGRSQYTIGRTSYSYNSDQCGGTAYPVPGMCTSLFHPDPGDSFAPFRLERNNSFTHYKTYTTSLYAFDTITLSPQWLLNAGVRIDRYRTEQWDGSSSFSREDMMFNYQLGVVYKRRPNASIYASTGTSTTPGGGAPLAGASAEIQPLRGRWNLRKSHRQRRFRDTGYGRQGPHRRLHHRVLQRSG